VQDPSRRRASPPNRPLKVIVHRSHSGFDFSARGDRKEVTWTRRKRSRLTQSCRNQTLAHHHCRCHTSLHSEHPHRRLASCQHRCRVCLAHRSVRIKGFKTMPSRGEATTERCCHPTPHSRILAFTRRLDAEGEERSVSSTTPPQVGQ
jgi:hypothetical protein